MTNIFDNAESITIGGKEVESIVIGNATLYEKPTPAVVTRDITLTIYNGADGVKYGRGAKITLSNGKYGTSNINSNIILTDVEDGTYSLVGYDELLEKNYDGVEPNSITVDENHTSFDVYVVMANLVVE